MAIARVPPATSRTGLPATRLIPGVAIFGVIAGRADRVAPGGRLDLDPQPSSQGGGCLGYKLSIDDGYQHRGRMPVEYGQLLFELEPVSGPPLL